MASGSARRLLALLGRVPTEGLCPVCAGAMLIQDKWEILTLIRELIGTGDVLCRYAVCGFCRQVQLVATLRGEAGRSDLP